MRLLTLALAAAFPLAGYAQKASEDWIALTTGSDTYAALTMNDSGQVFGQWCGLDDGNCLYMIALGTSCEQGAAYSSLANSDAGAQMLQLQCQGPVSLFNGTKYRYVFTDFSAIDVLVRKANRVGFAIPLKDGFFNVVRFTLASSNVQIDRMRAAAIERVNNNKNNPANAPGTRDTRL